MTNKYQGVGYEVPNELVREALKNFREEFELNKVQMANHLNVPYNTYARWENGVSNVRHKAVLIMALARLRQQLAYEDEYGKEEKEEKDS